MIWGKYDDIENEMALIDKVGWEFIKFYGLQKTPRLSPQDISNPLLQNTAQSYCKDSPEDDVRRATTHCCLRAQVCTENGSSHFEHQLRNRQNMPVEE